MENYLVSISDQLVQIDPRGLSEMDDLMALISSFGFDNSSTDIPETTQDILNHPNRLGVFQDEYNQYWLAEFKKTTNLIDLNLVGGLAELDEIAGTQDFQHILESRPYLSLQQHLQNHQVDLKHDDINGPYKQIYSKAWSLQQQLNDELVSDPTQFTQSVEECCREFWQVGIKLKPFDLSEHKEMLPHNFKSDHKEGYLLVEDYRIGWVGYRDEIEANWDTALDYDEFRDSCREVAVWALNAMF